MKKVMLLAMMAAVTMTVSAQDEAFKNAKKLFDKGSVDEAIKTVQRITSTNPTQIFDLLPRKFTAAQLHTVYQAVTGKSIDFRNFHKKIQSMPYVVQLEEKEQGVNHRAAHYFKFDRKKAVKN